MTKKQLTEIIKRVIKEECRKKLSEDINESSWIAVVWESGSSMPEPIAFLVSQREQALTGIPQGELADLLQDKLRITIDPNDFELESPMTLAEFQEEYENSQNPNRINIRNYPHIKMN